MRIWKKQKDEHPPIHVIDRMTRDRVFCVCGWSYLESNYREYAHMALLDRLLDQHATHAANMKELGA